MRTIVTKTDQEWQAQLTPEQYQVMRRKGTERPFTGGYYKTMDKGIYRCAACGTALFDARIRSSNQVPVGRASGRRLTMIRCRLRKTTAMACTEWKCCVRRARRTWDTYSRTDRSQPVNGSA